MATVDFDPKRDAENIRATVAGYKPGSESLLPCLDRLLDAALAVPVDTVCCSAEPVSVDDPWAHRSAGMRCGSCMWYVAKTGTTSGIGRCRRHCPTMSGYPVVYLHDWCGDHKLDERKA